MVSQRPGKHQTLCMLPNPPTWYIRSEISPMNRVIRSLSSSVRNNSSSMPYSNAKSPIRECCSKRAAYYCFPSYFQVYCGDTSSLWMMPSSSVSHCPYRQGETGKSIVAIAGSRRVSSGADNNQKFPSFGEYSQVIDTYFHQFQTVMVDNLMESIHRCEIASFPHNSFVIIIRSTIHFIQIGI